MNMLDWQSIDRSPLIRAMDDDPETLEIQFSILILKNTKFKNS